MLKNRLSKYNKKYLMPSNHTINQICIKQELKSFYLFVARTRYKMKNEFGFFFFNNQIKLFLYKGIELFALELIKISSLRIDRILKT